MWPFTPRVTSCEPRGKDWLIGLSDGRAIRVHDWRCYWADDGTELGYDTATLRERVLGAIKKYEWDAEDAARAHRGSLE